MRIFDTKYFIDKNRELVRAYYEHDNDLRNASTLRALLELKLYHLPPYFETTNKIKIALNNMFRSTEGNTVLEYDLLHPNATIAGQAPRDACPKCGRHKQLITLKETMCAECWSNLLHTLYSLWKAQVTWTDAPIRFFNLREAYHESYPVPGYEWFWEIEQWKDLVELGNITAMKQEFRFILQGYKRKQGSYVAHSPKHTLLAHLIGCRSCGAKHQIDTLWTSPADDWLDGFCPKCKPKRGIWHNSQYEPLGYDECVVCHNLHLPYAMWGMCVECYTNWQDLYLSPDLLYATAKELGTTALLLIRPEVQWVSYIKNHLPTSYSSKRISSDVVEWKPKLKLLRADINVKERVNAQIRGIIDVP